MFFYLGTPLHARILLPHAVIRAQLWASAQPGARGQHLLVKPVSGNCRSAEAQVTGLCKPGCLLCAPVSAILRTGLRLGSGCQAPWVLKEGSCTGICALSLGLCVPGSGVPALDCAPSPGSAPLTGYPSLGSAFLLPRWSPQPSRTHTEEESPLRLVPGPCSLQLP